MDNPWLTTPLFAAAAVLLTIGGYSLRFYEVPAARSFTAVTFLGAAWAFTYALGILDGSLNDKILLLKERVSLQPFIPAAFFVTAIEHAHFSRWLNHPRKLLLLLVPLITLGLAWNDSLFPLLRNNIRIIPNSPVLQSDPGMWAYMVTGYSYILGIGTLGVFLYSLRHSRGIYFLQTLYLTLALLIPVAASLITSAGIVQIGPPAITSPPAPSC